MKKNSISIILAATSFIFSITLYSQQFNPNKWFRFTNNHYGARRSLAIIETNGVKFLQMEATSNHISQFWKIVDRGRENYRLINMETGDNVCLEVKKDGFQTNIQLTAVNEDGSQFWKLFDKGNGYYQIINAGNGTTRSLEASSDRQRAFKSVFLSNTDLQRINQLWQIQEITAAPQYAKTEIKGPDGFSKGADEDGALNFNFKADVAYGANGSFLYKYGVTGVINFNNETFGGDPAPGSVKYGFYKQVVETKPIEEKKVIEPVVNKPVIDNNNNQNNNNNNNTIVNIPLPSANEWVRITNKILGDQFDLDYNVESQKFSFQLIKNGWKLESVVNSTADQFKILVNINGKDWALSADKYGIPKLAEKSSADGYQYWNIQKLPDGYYKIMNSVLYYQHAPNAYLFCDANKKGLFMTGWDEAKTLNGRWLLNPYGAIANAPVDELDNKKMELVSVGIQKSLCYEGVLVSDYIVSHIVPCTADPQKFSFKKTITGEYLISNGTNGYLDSRLELVKENINPAEKPPAGFGWKITKVSNLYYRISNGDNYLEYKNFSSPSPIHLYKYENKVEQLWYFR